MASVLISKKAMSDMKSLHQAKQLLLEIYSVATEEPFSFLFVNLMQPDINKLFMVRFEKLLRCKINFSTTHFYKIVCRDFNTFDIYVGHTTDFITRKNCHKQVCNNPSSKNDNLPFYKFIRDNQGWDNFDMILIETQCLNSSLEAIKIEMELIEELKPSLIKLIPFRTDEEKRR